MGMSKSLCLGHERTELESSWLPVWLQKAVRNSSLRNCTVDGNLMRKKSAPSSTVLHTLSYGSWQLFSMNTCAISAFTVVVSFVVRPSLARARSCDFRRAGRAKAREHFI